MEYQRLVAMTFPFDSHAPMSMWLSAHNRLIAYRLHWLIRRPLSQSHCFWKCTASEQWRQKYSALSHRHSGTVGDTLSACHSL